jgi:hypothetical protein
VVPVVVADEIPILLAKTGDHRQWVRRVGMECQPMDVLHAVAKMVQLLRRMALTARRVWVARPTEQ